MEFKEENEKGQILKKVTETLKKGKYSKYITFILIGVLVFVIFMPVSKNTSTVTDSESEKKNDYSNQNSTERYYEERLKNTLENIYGADTMEVMIYMNVETKETWYGNENENVSIDGVLVVAHVNDENAVSDISYAVCSLFDLPAHKVAVMVKQK